MFVRCILEEIKQRGTLPGLIVKLSVPSELEVEICIDFDVGADGSVRVTDTLPDKYAMWSLIATIDAWALSANH